MVHNGSPCSPSLFFYPAAALVALLAACGSPAEQEKPEESGTAESGHPEMGDSAGEETGGPPPCTEPASEPGLTSEGHPADGWGWEHRGPVWPDAAPVEGSPGDAMPTLVQWNGEYLLVFSRYEGGEFKLYRSQSADTLTWSTPELVTGLDGADLNHPGLIVYEGELRLYFGMDPIKWAVSTDGRHFEESGIAVGIGGPGRFDSNSVRYPHPTVEDGRLVLYYTAYDADRFTIGRAESSDGGASWGAGSLFFEPDPAGWDNRWVAMARVHTLSDERLMWYGGYDTTVGDPGYWRVGLYRAGHRSVSIPLAASGTESRSIQDPTLVPYRGGWLMAYTARGDDTLYRIHLATSTVCSQ